MDLRGQIDSLKSSNSGGGICPPAQSADSYSQQAVVVPPSSNQPGSHLGVSNYDRKFNLVFLGLPESTAGTPFRVRQKHDNDLVSSTISSLSSDSQPPDSIRDHFRLGKYDKSISCPRPLLVKFNSVMTVYSVLSLNSRLSALGEDTSVVIKKDLSKEERKCESLLLKERYRLIDSEGLDKQSIRIRGNKLYINSKLYGEAQPDGFTLLSDVAPCLAGGIIDKAAVDPDICTDSRTHSHNLDPPVHSPVDPQSSRSHSPSSVSGD